MTLPLLLPMTLGLHPWRAVDVAPGRVERLFSGESSRIAWNAWKAELLADLTEWLRLNMATPGRILSWASLATEGGGEVRATVEFDDGKVWRITYGRISAGNWRVRKVHGV